MTSRRKFKGKKKHPNSFEELVHCQSKRQLKQVLCPKKAEEEVGSLSKKIHEDNW